MFERFLGKKEKQPYEEMLESIPAHPVSYAELGRIPFPLDRVVSVRETPDGLFVEISLVDSVRYSLHLPNSRPIVVLNNPNWRGSESFSLDRVFPLSDVKGNKAGFEDEVLAIANRFEETEK